MTIPNTGECWPSDYSEYLDELKSDERDIAENLKREKKLKEQRYNDKNEITIKSNENMVWPKKTHTCDNCNMNINKTCQITGNNGCWGKLWQSKKEQNI